LTFFNQRAAPDRSAAGTRMPANVGVALPVAMAQETRFGLAGVFWARPATFPALQVLHGPDYVDKEKADGLFRQSGDALGAAGGRAPGA
jgi:hypothetical protein